MPFLKEVLENYFAVHHEMISAEEVDADNLLVSFPLHFVGRHRVEVSVTKAAKNLFVLSDVGRTIGELRQYGYTVSPKLLARIVQIAKPAEVRVVSENLIMDCRPSEIGISLHVFAEVAKTVGDALLSVLADGRTLHISQTTVLTNKKSGINYHHNTVEFLSAPGRTGRP